MAYTNMAADSIPARNVPATLKEDTLTDIMVRAHGHAGAVLRQALDLRDRVVEPEAKSAGLPPAGEPSHVLFAARGTEQTLITVSQILDEILRRL